LRSGLGFKPRQANLANGKRIKVCEEKLAIAKVEPRGLNHSRDQLGLVLEVVSVMWGITRAVRKDKRTLPATPRATRALGVVRWVRRSVAEMNYSQAPNVYSEFHCGRAEQCTNGLAANLGVVRLGLFLV